MRYSKDKRSETSKKGARIGKIAPSQIVTSVGIGSIYELRSFAKRGPASLHSVMIAGLDWWPEEDLSRVREPLLERALGVRYFCLPPVEDNDSDSVVPAIRFPKWLVCRKCNRLGIVPHQFNDFDSGPMCAAQGCKGKGIPVRLVTACYSQNAAEGGDMSHPGHISDFPWEWWCHSGRACEAPELKLETTGTTTALAGLVVRCYSNECKGKVQRTLEGVLGENALRGFRCSGKSPWLQTETPCERPIRVLLRSASNVFFPVTSSAVSIPPMADELHQLLLRSGDVILRSSGTVPTATLVEMLRNAFPKLRSKYSVAQIENAIANITSDKSARQVTEADVRRQERDALVAGTPDTEHEGAEFIAEPLDCTLHGGPLADCFVSLVKVHRLREVRAYRGFTRVVPAMGMDSYTTACAPIARTKKDWLPAIEVRGEGIYFELDARKIASWECRGPVQVRIGALKRNYKVMLRDIGGEEREDYVTPSRVLVHTLTHLLIKQFSMDCGYSESSLRERLYVAGSEDNCGMQGAMIYTASPGSDGTLGGLVRLGTPESFNRTLIRSLRTSRWCSSDPLCIEESKGQGIFLLNLAACHACCLISETCCELRNTLLDRALLVGTPDQPEIGFFSEWLTLNDR